MLGLISQFRRIEKSARKQFLAAKLEEKLLLSQGKGYGANSTTAEIAVILSFCSTLNIERIVAVDVGANVGKWAESLLRLSPEAKITCFEPSRAAFEKLQALPIPQNSKVDFVRAAVSRGNGNATLHYDEAASGLASLTRRRLDHFNIDFNLSETVETINLDTYFKDSAELPNVIKLDIEGHELDALAGALQILKSVSICQFEFGGCNIDTRTYWQDFWYFFTDLGFDLYRVTPDGPYHVKKYLEIDECFVTTNYVAVRKVI